MKTINGDKYARAIRAGMAYTGHTQETLARKMGISTDTLKRRLDHPGRFTIAELEAAERVVKWSEFLPAGGGRDGASCGIK